MAQLARLLVPGDVLPLQLTDAQAGRQLVATAREQVSHANWSGPTWARLAALARLVGQAGPADVFAREAHARGAPLTAYAEITARQLLAADRAEEAAPHAGYLLEQTGGAPPAALLLARALLALGNDTEAAELLGYIDDSALLRPRERLELARAHLRLHNWPAMAAALDGLEHVPTGLDPERSFLHAVVLTQLGERLPEALAILDFHADPATVDAAVKTDEGHQLAPPQPDSYEVATWRGVTLMRGRQLEAARQAFDAAIATDPDRPEACYWRAVLELNDGQIEAAKAHLHRALAIASRHAPAWETLGGVALTSGDLDAAREYAERSLAINGRRPSAHFLLALIHGTAFRRDEAAAALQRTFALDPAYLEEAAQADVLRRLFTPEELAELSAEVTAPPP
jgi:tetratricopeptide (TPR) repeat protein